MNLTLVESWSTGSNHIPQSAFQDLEPKPGDSIRVGVINGPQGVVRVTGLEGDHIIAEGSLDHPPMTPLPLSLCMAYSRPKMFRRAFQSAVEIGVRDFHLFRSFLCEKSYEFSDVFSEESLNSLSRLALQQSADTQMPQWKQHTHFRPFVEDHLTPKFDPTRVIVAHPDGQDIESLSMSPRGLLVGPERGFTEKEIVLCDQMGFEVVSFGKRQLRYENAVPFILGRLFRLLLE